MEKYKVGVIGATGMVGELAADGCIGLAAGELAALLPEARRMVENGEI